MYGQPNFTSNTANNGGVSATSLFSPRGTAVDPTGGLYVADLFNNRVLHYSIGSTTADRVYGQPNFTSGTANAGGVNAASLNLPRGVAVDTNTGGLFVADYGNNRVLHYPAGSTTADRVYGQPTFTSSAANAGSVSATSLWGPQGAAVDTAGGLYVADYSNSRVLHYPVGSTIADRVYGQPTFTANAPNNGRWVPSATSLSGPQSVTLDTLGALYVSDQDNNRVLHYPTGSTTANRVYGQPNFASNVPNNGGVSPSASSLSGPQGAAVDAAGGLYVADNFNSRMLHYPSGNTTPDRVYGQPDFTSGVPNNGGVSAVSLSGPSVPAVNTAGGLYLADNDNNRVLRYP